MAGCIAWNVSEKYSFCNRDRIINKSSINQDPLPVNLSPFCSIFKQTIDVLTRLFNDSGTVTYSIPGKILKHIILKNQILGFEILPLGINNIPIGIIQTIGCD